MSASGPYGKWTMADLAEELNIGLPWLRQSLLDKGCPKLVPDLTAGRLNLYGDATAESWLTAYRKWREEEPARKAAKRADDESRARFARKAEMNRIAVEQRLMENMQAATDASIAVVVQGLIDDDLDYVLSPTFIHHCCYIGLDPDTALNVKIKYLRGEINRAALSR